ncbi:hypothetical protein RGU70_02165 [Herbaspirillum sp. RTI4]|uniref:LPS translocon maturation chaperone LptM n=1 Tax=Herbaspirillum sp. RTI4 TaxID=3048640 RepID=UPI002AB3DBD6|nr:hypothetical protein [Herbaspirillum sp. RTI4]MDY7577131.1 hypothetical protein [Herbaspirillum sp. RTI4]MEA9982873.1 hypothetical protein [Herbaspirillum sp. RTI4]
MLHSDVDLNRDFIVILTSRFVSLRTPLLGAALTVMLLSAGCGQKGPLFMPIIPPDPLLPRPVASVPAPASSSAKPARSASGTKAAPQSDTMSGATTDAATGETGAALPYDAPALRSPAITLTPEK